MSRDQIELFQEVEKFTELNRNAQFRLFLYTILYNNLTYNFEIKINHMKTRYDKFQNLFEFMQR